MPQDQNLASGIASIVCGSAVAGWQGSFSALIAGLALLTALLLQILSNLANDYGDAVKGTDNKHRLGPQRAIQSGMVTPSAMRNAMILNTVLTITSGLSLIFIACNNLQDMFGFMLLGLMAIAASIAYTVGNKPYGYRGLGDLSVLMFFGWLGVAGTYYLQAGQIDSIIMLPATACGLLSVGVLNINNLRDIDNDRACGKLTLAVRMGPDWGGRKYTCSCWQAVSSAWHCLRPWSCILPLAGCLFSVHRYCSSTANRFSNQPTGGPLFVR